MENGQVTDSLAMDRPLTVSAPAAETVSDGPTGSPNGQEDDGQVAISSPGGAIRQQRGDLMNWMRLRSKLGGSEC